MIFILGGLGFVGSAFVRCCEKLALPYQVVDLANYSEFIGQSCDVLINANGNSKKYLARQSPVEEFDLSVRSVRSSLVDFKFGFYVYLSTCDVYPDCSSPDTTREDQPVVLGSQSDYGFHKHLAEMCVQHSTPRWLIIRMGGLVGKGMRKNPIFDILYGDRLWLDPRSELQYLHTDQNASIIMQLIQQGCSGDIFNLCGKGLIQLSEVMDMVGRNIEVESNSPLLRYDVNINKISQRTIIPETRETVFSFIQANNKTG